MAALTRTFSASVAWRNHVVMNTWLGDTLASAVARLAGSSRSAASGRTPSTSMAGRRARPYTVQPCLMSSRAVLLPPMPLTPTTNAVLRTVALPCAMGLASFYSAALRASLRPGDRVQPSLLGTLHERYGSLLQNPRIDALRLERSGCPSIFIGGTIEGVGDGHTSPRVFPAVLAAVRGRRGIRSGP